MAFAVPSSYEFICECATVSCLERISLTLEEYEGVRKAGATFFVSPGHVYDEIELVTERHQTYWVVQKDGAAGVASEFADPRDGDSA